MENSIKNIILIVLVLSLWQLAYAIFDISTLILMPPLDIFHAFVKLIANGEIFVHALDSLLRVIIGFSLASVLGIFLSLFFAYYVKIGNFFSLIIEVLRPIPPIAWIPFAILIFGLGNYSASFIVFMGAFFPIFTNTYFGAISLPKTLKNTVQSFELSKIQYLTKILFFYSLPYIFAGLKIGIGMAWMSVIAAELIGAQSGLGYFIQMNRLMLRTDNILVGMITIGLIGYSLNMLLTLLESRVIRWRIV